MEMGLIVYTDQQSTISLYIALGSPGGGGWQMPVNAREII